MILQSLLLGTNHVGYIAGVADGIVTANGSRAARDVILLDAHSLQVLNRHASLSNGHYILSGLNSDHEYMVMVRDYKKELEPFVWDYVKPAEDITVSEQQALWMSWQTN